MKKIFVLLIVISGVNSSCIKNPIENNPKEIFEFIWKDFDENYSSFPQRNIDWDAIHNEYSPQVSESTSRDELWNVLINMLDVLDDQHVGIVDTKDGKGFASGKLYDEVVKEKGFDIELVKRDFLDADFKTISTDSDETDGEELTYGRIKNQNFGYLHLPNFSDGDWMESMDIIIADLMSTDGLILDVRNNGGGDPLAAEYVSGFFAATRVLAFNVQTKNGPGREDFDEKAPYYMEPRGDQQYTKPIVALTNHSTVSAGEEFLLYLITQNHVTVVGDVTSNAFSTTTFDRLLPNGFWYQLSHQLYTYPDGTSPEGTGIIPDILLVNDSLDVQNGIDMVLDRGILELQ